MDEAEREASYFPGGDGGRGGGGGRRTHKPIGEKEILRKIDILMPNRVRACVRACVIVVRACVRPVRACAGLDGLWWWWWLCLSATLLLIVPSNQID